MMNAKRVAREYFGFGFSKAYYCFAYFTMPNHKTLA